MELSFKEFKNFEDDVYALVRMKDKNRSGFSTIEMNEGRKKLAMERYGVERVYLKGKMPVGVVIAEVAPVVVPVVENVKPIKKAKKSKKG